ncbi:MAG: DUF6288 domain-containing protein [Phycisphaeraceae bacterium]
MAYPAFQVGVTGAWVSIEPGHVMTVQRIDEGTPADGKLKVGDVILEANRRTIKGPDPRVPLGEALTEAEGGAGVLRLGIERAGREGVVGLRVPKLGAYSGTWPVDCEKSATIVRDHARWLAEQQNPRGGFGERGGGDLMNCMGALFLLSTDDPAYDQHVRRFAHMLARETERRPSRSTWHLGYQVIFLCEYYLKTGDETVLAAIRAACDLAAQNQAAGAWGHYMSGLSVGYVQSGLMNSAGVTMFLGMALARECGITVHEQAFQRALRFFYRMPGHGSICYGDHRAEIYIDTNGRNAAIACAFSLFDQQPFESAAQQLAMMVADSYNYHEIGHTGGGFNALWRGIAIVHTPEQEQGRVRRHMRELAWYYDLCRLPAGGFSLLPSPPNTTRYTGEAWGHGLGLTYTAPLKTLRITGGPRTEHSKPTPKLDPELWGTGRDTAFLQTDHAEGYGEEAEPPHQTIARLQSREPLSVDDCAKLMRHYNPVIRTFAAARLGKLRSDAAYDAIEAALGHGDPRVRRAGCDAISAYENWRRNGTAGIPRNVVSERFIPHIERMLTDPNAAWWEIDGALWALGAGEPADIRRNRQHIDRFTEHEEWYLRESAYWALVGLGREITGDEFIQLGLIFDRARHVFERSSYDSGINYLLRRVKVKLEPKDVARYVKTIADQMYDAAIAGGYDEFAARHEAAHRVMMVINRFDDPPYALIAEELATYMKGWAPGNQHSDWLITGNKWQPGLAHVAGELGASAGPIIEAFERCLKQGKWDLKDKNQQASRDAMQKAVAAYHARD